MRTFSALEAAASEWSQRGGWLHLWMWGKGAGGDIANLPGGYNGQVSRRINRYIAARLGPVPGWSMGVGWDVEFCAEPTGRESVKVDGFCDSAGRRSLDTAI